MFFQKIILSTLYESVICCQNKCRCNYTYNGKKAFVNFAYCLLSFQRKMRFYLKKFFCVCALLLFVFVWWSFSYEANTWNTDFSFAWWAKDFPIILLGWDSRVVPFYLTNNSDATISGNFDVVDAIEMSGWLRACKANWQNDVFGKYWMFEQTGFSLAWNSRFSGSVTLKFPEWYSGDYLWCITYTPYWEEDGQSINPQPRKALFLKAMLSATASLYQLKVFPWDRTKPTLANRWEIRFYDKNKQLVYFSWDIETDSWWIAEFSALIPDGVYDVIYKWQSHLASYLSGVQVSAWTTYLFDFTTWLNLVWAKDKYNNDGFKYQIAWDLKNASWAYDFTINWMDVSVITYYWYVNNGVDPLDPRNLNWDDAINGSDLSIIWINFMQQDVFYWEDAVYDWLLE